MNKEQLLKLTKKQLLQHVRVRNSGYTKKQVQAMSKPDIANFILGQLSRAENLPTDKTKKLTKESLKALPPDIAAMIHREMSKTNVATSEKNIIDLVKRYPYTANAYNHVFGRYYPNREKPVNVRKLIYLTKYANPNVNGHQIIRASRGIHPRGINWGVPGVRHINLNDMLLLEKKMKILRKAYNMTKDLKAKPTFQSNALVKQLEQLKI